MKANLENLKRLWSIDHESTRHRIEPRFFGYNGKPILNDTSLVVERGDFVGVVGANGTGKSTLIRLALGLLSPDQGEIRLLGQNITQFREWYRIGYMAQKVASFNTGFPATVREIVETHLRTQKSPHGTLSRRAIKTRVEQALDLAGMRGKELPDW